MGPAAEKVHVKFFPNFLTCFSYAADASASPNFRQQSVTVTHANTVKAALRRSLRVRAD